ncbi:hypothetical protein [Massilia sp. CFBP9026]|uniref:hypothetical protein n=1 Tax=Massilia sp. CFBP9026 TaxID=3096536 RepID=UPI002A6A88ED|nr:hypothetical protein [Massilia sp. CFBP9026]MDY0962969.1 hypothetical protein [Massilia sp. CFBP9026]
MSSLSTVPRRLCGLLSLTLFAAAPWASAAAPTPGLSVVVKPLVTNGKVEALEVRQILTKDLPAGDTPLRFRAPLGLFGVKTIADKITGLSVLDANGPVPLTIENKPGQVGPATGFRYWQAARKTVAPVTVSYRIPTQPATEGGGPPYGMKASGQGVSGSGLGFLLLPANTTSTATRFDWDLSELPRGSIGAMTAGAGATLLAGGPSELDSQWMLAGPVQVHDPASSPGLHVYFLGQQPFDRADILDFATRSHAILASSLKYLGTPEYRLFIRSLDVPSYATGTGRTAGGGALLSTGTTLGGQSLDKFKNTVFHEMAHHWVGDLSGAGGWFVEGLTTYLSATLPCEQGLADAPFCALGVNGFGGDYYRSPARNWSLERIDGIGSGDENTRRVPYGRGLLYFGLVNSQLLAKSQGRRNVIDVLIPMFVDRSKGIRLDEAAWETMLLRELGQPAVDEFRASVIEGSKTIVPPSDAFGPCLTRVALTMTEIGSSRKVEGYEWRPVAGCNPRKNRT